ncbi:NAD(P)-dependent oxidoreductase [Salinirubrum litoreum]|uniref:NAD(P)-dependent oxidoreductase n=1 Tax=Salinirubrum litoreum TaxID=1126234 RepID=A0ABD5RCL9_9EURY|nr:NAD(P)-dependent oxidoreductase [Salinirubrum litoreum]
MPEFEVVASDDPMLDPKGLRAVLGTDTDLSVADLRSTDALVAACEGADAVVTDVSTPVPREAIERLSLSVIGRAGVGVDNIDVAAAAEADVTVVHVPDYCTDEVATHSLTLLLSTLRGVASYDRQVAGGGWGWEDGRAVHRLHGSSVGIVSFGPIARRFAGLLSGFDVDVLASDPFVDAETMADHGVTKRSYEAMVDEVDHLVSLAPLTPETRGMVGAETFAALPEHAVVVNTGRGGVVDEAALAEALDAGEIGAAGLDVLDEEPPHDSPVVGRDDVIVTPHAGWYSVQARDELNRDVGQYVAEALRGERPEGWIDPSAEWL